MDVVVSSERIDANAWGILIENSTFVHPLQSLHYYDIIGNSVDSEISALPFHLNSAGEIKASVIVTLFDRKSFRGFFSRRGIVFGGPVLSNYISSEEVSFFLREVASKLRGKVIYLEVRCSFDYSAYKESFEAAGWDYVPYLNYQLSLSGIEKKAIHSFFNYNRRREVKISLSEGAYYGLCISENDFDDLYQILQELYTKRVKLPLPTIGYFKLLYKNDLMKVFIVKHGGSTIGGSFCLVQPGRTIYTYYYCGLRDYHKRIFPTHLAILAAMEYAIDNNIPVVDFMGAGKPDIDYGVRKYKSEFGGKLVEHGRYIKTLNPFLYNLGRIGLKVMSRV
jgi:hypothetical protein